MSISPVAAATHHANVEHPKIIRPLKNKLTRVTPARSFDFGWAFADLTENKHPPYTSRYGGNKKMRVPTEVEATPPENASPDEEPSATDMHPGLLQQTVERLEAENAFLRNLLVTSEENVHRLITLLADRVA